jgi:hypothetical protein
LSEAWKSEAALISRNSCFGDSLITSVPGLSTEDTTESLSSDSYFNQGDLPSLMVGTLNRIVTVGYTDQSVSEGMSKLVLHSSVISKGSRT